MNEIVKDGQMTTAGGKPAKPQDTAEGQAALRKRLVAVVRDMMPLLRENAPKAEAERRVPQATINAMHKAGLFRLRSPAIYGGHEGDCLTYFDVVAELGRGCGSASWITFVSTGAAWSISGFPEEVRREVFGPNPDARFNGVMAPTSTAERVEGGYRVTGRWDFSSGCLHADWAFMSVPLPDESGRRNPSAALIPMEELTIEDTWYYAAAAGTGSNTVIAKDVFVPTRRTMSRSVQHQGDALGAAWKSPVYREAFSAGIVIMAAAPIVGMAEAAFDLTLERVNTGNKRIAFSVYADLRKSPAMVVKIAEARSLIDRARDSLRTWCARIADASRAGEEMPYLDRARMRVDIASAMTDCRAAVGQLMGIQGASAFASSNPIQRIWRDVEFTSRHGMLTPDVPLEILGRELFGYEEKVSDLV